MKFRKKLKVFKVKIFNILMNEIKLLIHEIYNNFESSNYFYEHLIKITNLNIKKCRRRIKENEKILLL